MAMTITKDLTNHSLPEIGDAFGGRDHTTVIHAYKKIKELRETDGAIEEDYSNLVNLLMPLLMHNMQYYYPYHSYLQ